MFNWTDYLDLSVELAALETGAALSEARLRTAISRAYYCCYCKADDWLNSYPDPIDRRPLPRNIGVHQRLWLKFQRRSAISQQAVGHLGEALKLKRANADYDNPYPSTDLLLEATQAIEDAIVLNELINHL